LTSKKKVIFICLYIFFFVILQKSLILENYRLSSHTISVKLDNADGKYMLVHGYTGAMDIVNEKVVGFLNSIKTLQNGDGQLAESTINSLKIRGYLTTKTREDEVEYVRKLANLLHKKEKVLHKNFLFLVAYDCNFRCSYCYESKVLKNSRQWSKKVFTKEDEFFVQDLELRLETDPLGVGGLMNLFDTQALDGCIGVDCDLWGCSELCAGIHW
jgi:uncharacterized protein